MDKLVLTLKQRIMKYLGNNMYSNWQIKTFFMSNGNTNKVADKINAIEKRLVEETPDMETSIVNEVCLRMSGIGSVGVTIESVLIDTIAQEREI